MASHLNSLFVLITDLLLVDNPLGKNHSVHPIEEYVRMSNHQELCGKKMMMMMMIKDANFSWEKNLSTRQDDDIISRFKILDIFQAKNLAIHMRGTSSL